MSPTSRTNNNASNPQLRRAPRRQPSSINPDRGFNRSYTGSSGFSNSSDFSNRGGFSGGFSGGFPGGFSGVFGNFGGRDGGASHGHPTTFTRPAPLTARSLSTHNQMQSLESPRVKSPQHVPFDTAYVQQVFNQSRSRSVSNANSDAQSATARRMSGNGIMGMMNPGPPTASSGGTGRRSYGQFITQGHSMSIEALLSKPPGGNLMEALKDLRFLILRDGIPTDVDGHVRCSTLWIVECMAF